MFDIPVVNLLVAVALIVAGVGWSFRDWVKPTLAALPGYIRWPSCWSKSPEATDPDVADFIALKRVAARYKRLDCPEGQAAVRVLFTHFMHEAA